MPATEKVDILFRSKERKKGRRERERGKKRERERERKKVGCSVTPFEGKEATCGDILFYWFVVYFIICLLSYYQK